jgi:hypothetical protein
MKGVILTLNEEKGKDLSISETTAPESAPTTQPTVILSRTDPRPACWLG